MTASPTSPSTLPTDHHLLPATYAGGELSEAGSAWLRSLDRSGPGIGLGIVLNDPDLIRDERTTERAEDGDRGSGGASEDGEQAGEGGEKGGGESEGCEAGPSRADYGKGDRGGDRAIVPIGLISRAGAGAGLGGRGSGIDVEDSEGEMANIPARSLVSVGRLGEVMIGVVSVPLIRLEPRASTPCRPSPFRAIPARARACRQTAAVRESAGVADQWAPSVSVRVQKTDVGDCFQQKKAYSPKLLPQDGEEVVEVFGQLWSVSSPNRTTVPPPGGGLVWIRKDLFLSKKFTPEDCYPARVGGGRSRRRRSASRRSLWRGGADRATYAEVVKGMARNRGGGRRGGGGGTGRGEGHRPVGQVLTQASARSRSNLVA